MKFWDYDLYHHYDPFTAEWYRQWKKEHLARYPDLPRQSPTSIANIDAAIAEAVEREATEVKR